MTKYLKLNYAKLFLTIGAIMLGGCDNSESTRSNKERLFVDGKKWYVNPSERLAYVAEPPRYLRVRFDPEFDLVVDERFNTDQRPDFMSVLATQYGAGSRKQIGPHQIGCGEIHPYSCGLKFAVNGAHYLVIFKTEPTSAATIEQMLHRAGAFIQERS